MINGFYTVPSKSVAHNSGKPVLNIADCSKKLTPRPIQPSQANSAFHLSGVGNEHQLQQGRQRQVWLIPTADERVGVPVKLILRTHATPERF